MVGPAARLALVFPGQGAQKVGMGKALHDADARARSVFERADAALDVALSRTCFEGPEELLRMTATTQPAILTASLAAWEAFRERAGDPLAGRIACAAGHSLGEYAALVAAGAIGLEDAVRTVRRRGEYMQDAVPVGQGAMAAVLGIGADDVRRLCDEAAAGEVLSAANLNAPDQTVVAGAAAAVDRLAARAKETGRGKVIRLPVSAPFHCALMAPARERLARDLERLPIRDAAFPVVLNVSARPARAAEEIRRALVEQVTAPVRWAESVAGFEKLGVTVQIEFGPGRVLAGLARRIVPGLQALNVEDPASLESTIQTLGG
jgi:[acyl-carrier-protein] S-malonyltransferase